MSCTVVFLESSLGLGLLVKSGYLFGVELGFAD
jgi:hypothetical protein